MLKRIITTPSARAEVHTKEVLRRARSLYPKIKVIDLPDEKPPFPNTLTPAEKFWYSKESLVLTTRKGSFGKTFPSPGNIVENPITLFVLAWHCEYNCEFCYLQNSLVSWKQLFMNMDDLQDQISTEIILNGALLSLWSAISFHEEKSLLKAPKGFDKEGDRIRNHFLSKEIDSEEDAILYLKENLIKCLENLNIKVDSKKLPKIIKDLPIYFEKNRQFRLRLNISEYTDIIAIDPISGYLSLLMPMLSVNPEIDLNVRTKSAHVDEMVAHDGNEQVRFTMTVNTQPAIDNWEHDTASIDERIEAMKKVQDANGFRVKLAFEPILYYDGCEDEYVHLAERLMKELDTESLEKISIGSVRYKKQLMTRVKRNHPSTSLFDHSNMFVDPTKPDTKVRLEYDWRVKLYKRLIKVFKANTNTPIELGAELPDVWNDVGLQKSNVTRDSVYQYPGK